MADVDNKAVGAALKAEKNFKDSYGARAHNGVETTGTSVAAQQVYRNAAGEPAMGPASDDTMSKAGAAEDYAQKFYNQGNSLSDAVAHLNK